MSHNFPIFISERCHLSMKVFVFRKRLWEGDYGLLIGLLIPPESGLLKTHTASLCCQ